jgi:hypothetical protein
MDFIDVENAQYEQEVYLSVLLEKILRGER